MTVGFVDRVVGTHNIPESVRALSSLPDIDYADQFTLTTDADATPEQWARAMFGDVPSVAELLIWRALPPETTTSFSSVTNESCSMRNRYVPAVTF